MIIQTAPEGAPRLVITMDEHTALAGQFARAFGNANFQPVEPRELMLEGELERQARLKAELAKDPEARKWIEEEHLFQNYRQLQFFDTFALYFNRDHESARSEATFPRVPMTPDKDATITVRPLEPSVYAVSPYPFNEDNAEFSFTGRYVKPLAQGSHGDFAPVLRSAPTSWQRFTLVDRS